MRETEFTTGVWIRRGNGASPSQWTNNRRVITGDKSSNIKRKGSTVKVTFYNTSVFIKKKFTVIYRKFYDHG